MANTYQTQGRKKLLSFLLKYPDKQFTVDELHSAMTQAGADGEASQASKASKGGRSSLYRQLSKLCDEGCVRKYRADHQASFTYQYVGGLDCCHHFHLKCVACGEVTHLECAVSDELLTHIAEHHRFRIDSGRSMLYGLCAACESASAEDACPEA